MQSSLALALAVQCSLSAEGVAKPAPTLDGALRRVGGEGRAVRLQAADWSAPSSPDMANATAVEGKITLRFILTTPAVFPSMGWCPDVFQIAKTEGAATDNPSVLQLNATLHECTVTLKAAAISRAQHYSGWVQRTGEKGTENSTEKTALIIGPGQPHRVVPAGSVFWFEVAQGEVADFIKTLHDQGLCTGTWQADGWGRGWVGKA